MKSIITAVAAILLSATIAHAQRISATGQPTWVIESNIKTPKLQTVKFYNARMELVYQETITGKKININRTRIRAKLNDMLAQLDKNVGGQEKNNLLAAALRK